MTSDAWSGSASASPYSTRLKELVSRLTAYHACLNDFAAAADPVIARVPLESALASLAQASAALADVAPQHRAVLDAFRAELRHEQGAVNGIGELLKTCKTGGYGALSAMQVLQLHRDGVPAQDIQLGIDAGLSASAIILPTAATTRARAPREVLTLDTLIQQADPDVKTVRKLGSGALHTVYQMDLVQHGSKDRMVFKPEHPDKDIGDAAERAGIPPAAPNLAGRSMATYLCSRALDLDLVPTTAVTVVEGQLGSVMSLVEGFQPVSAGSVRIRLSRDLADLCWKQPKVLMDYAVRCGCTSASLEGEVLCLERRVERPVVDPSGSRDRKSRFWQRKASRTPGELESVDLPIRIALPVNRGSFRKEMVRAQWLDVFTRQVDRTAMNFMMVAREDGELAVRLIDNDASFGNRLPEPSDDPTTGRRDPTRRTKLPLVIDRATFDAFMKFDVDALAAQLKPVLGDDAAVATTCEDARTFREQLLQYEEDGRVLDRDEQWASQDVAELLGIDHDGSGFKDATSKGTQKEQRAAQDRLQRRAHVTSYVAREAFDQEQLRRERRALQGKPGALAALPALFDLEELSVSLGQAAPAKRKAETR